MILRFALLNLIVKDKRLNSLLSLWWQAVLFKTEQYRRQSSIGRCHGYRPKLLYARGELAAMFDRDILFLVAYIWLKRSDVSLSN
ncbi:hypothetical protein A8144_02095 [Mycobacterium leprae 3125609]|nr:hypothetical protein A8144_02095 [Mycobacterium leprae 3125609]OAX72016.1 hypothetical protein A3216_02175 [Mycobacterium leprae 7935681]